METSRKYCTMVQHLPKNLTNIPFSTLTNSSYIFRWQDHIVQSPQTAVSECKLEIYWRKTNLRGQKPQKLSLATTWSAGQYLGGPHCQQQYTPLSMPPPAQALTDWRSNLHVITQRLCTQPTTTTWTPVKDNLVTGSVVC